MMLSFAVLLLLLPSCDAFRIQGIEQTRRWHSWLAAEPKGRRSLLETTGVAVLATITGTSLMPINPASAGIDVSGLKSSEGGNSAIAAQLRSFDGSGSARIQELKSASGTTGSTTTSFAARVAERSVAADPVMSDSSSTAATYAYRCAPGFNPKLTKVGFGATLRCDDQLVSPTGKGYLSVSFEFPADWLQLDKLLGGIQYVDQRNGDKLYLLRANLPATTDGNSNLATVPKTFFGDAIFDPQGTLIRSGITVDEYKIKSSVVLSDGSLSAPHRRVLIKYYTVTGNGLRTERRALVDAYQVDGVAYMLMTSSNAVKFDAMARERDTVEAIVDSFRIEQIA